MTNLLVAEFHWIEHIQAGSFPNFPQIHRRIFSALSNFIYLKPKGVPLSLLTMPNVGGHSLTHQRTFSSYSIPDQELVPARRWCRRRRRRRRRRRSEGDFHHPGRHCQPVSQYSIPMQILTGQDIDRYILRFFSSRVPISVENIGLERLCSNVVLVGGLPVTSTAILWYCLAVTMPKFLWHLSKPI